MSEIPQMPNEAERIEALRNLNILDTPPEARFDVITHQAMQEFNCKTCLISLVAEDRQWFKSRQGLSNTETPRNISFCTYAIAEEEYLIVPDALADFRFKNNKLVVGEPYIRSYAGVILHSPDGYEIGTFCLLHDDVKHYSEAQIERLKQYARIVELEMAANPEFSRS
ncbi:GAF domain-containing protein [Salinimonas chungwhensis]|jgi:GAF domain-containing protein|uniref:GAF domain-containing protein n=1 Tax=Salinimonas chungwhensis TaxID=265425 RepID=UPI0003723FD5|nr:GAF domain-containing protein [Salinimonas chungwhensis]